MKRKSLLFTAMLSVLLFGGCTAELPEEVQRADNASEQTIPEKHLAFLEKLGFSADDIVVTDDSYIIEDDIVMPKKTLDEIIGSPETRGLKAPDYSARRWTWSEKGGVLADPELEQGGVLYTGKSYNFHYEPSLGPKIKEYRFISTSLGVSNDGGNSYISEKNINEQRGINLTYTFTEPGTYYVKGNTEYYYGYSSGGLLPDFIERSGEHYQSKTYTVIDEPSVLYDIAYYGSINAKQYELKCYFLMRTQPQGVNATFTGWTVGGNGVGANDYAIYNSEGSLNIRFNAVKKFIVTANFKLLNDIPYSISKEVDVAASSQRPSAFGMNMIPVGTNIRGWTFIVTGTIDSTAPSGFGNLYVNGTSCIGFGSGYGAAGGSNSDTVYANKDMLEVPASSIYGVSSWIYGANNWTVQEGAEFTVKNDKDYIVTANTIFAVPGFAGGWDFDKILAFPRDQLLLSDITPYNKNEQYTLHGYSILYGIPRGVTLTGWTVSGDGVSTDDYTLCDSDGLNKQTLVIRFNTVKKFLITANFRESKGVTFSIPKIINIEAAPKPADNGMNMIPVGTNIRGWTFKVTGTTLQAPSGSGNLSVNGTYCIGFGSNYELGMMNNDSIGINTDMFESPVASYISVANWWGVPEGTEFTVKNDKDYIVTANTVVSGGWIWNFDKILAFPPEM